MGLWTSRVPRPLRRRVYEEGPAKEAHLGRSGAVDRAHHNVFIDFRSSASNPKVLDIDYRLGKFLFRPHRPECRPPSPGHHP